MTKIALIIACLTFLVFQESYALKCKSCKDDSCATLEDLTCTPAAADSEPACLTHIYKVNDKATTEKVEKKCVQKKKNAKYECVKQNPTEEVEIACTTCTEDLCNDKNAAPKLAMGPLAAFSVVTAILARKFL